MTVYILGGGPAGLAVVDSLKDRGIDDFILIENSEQDILNLYKNYSFETNKMEENRNAQNEIFDLKKYYVKKNLPDYFYYMNLNYPNNPIICKKFFEMNFDYNEYLNKKSENFIKELL